MILAFVVRDTTWIVFVWAELAVVVLALTAYTPRVFAGHYDLPAGNGTQDPLAVPGHATGGDA